MSQFEHEVQKLRLAVKDLVQDLRRQSEEFEEIDTLVYMSHCLHQLCLFTRTVQQCFCEGIVSAGDEFQIAYNQVAPQDHIALVAYLELVTEVRKKALLLMHQA